MTEKEKPLIYVCSPCDASEDNYKRTQRFGSYVIKQGYIPIIPNTMLYGIIDYELPKTQIVAVETAKRLIKMCDAVWVFGSLQSANDDMRNEISYAGDCGIPISFIDITEVWGADEKSIALSKCAQHYQNIFCTINGIIAGQMMDYMKHGITPELINECVTIAGDKGARWAYAKAILNSCLQRSVLTVEQFKNQNGKSKKQNKDYAGYDLALYERMLEHD